MFQASGHHPLFMIPGQQTDYKVSSYKCLQIGTMGCKCHFGEIWHMQSDTMLVCTPFRSPYISFDNNRVFYDF